jgi:hypothetical protein
VDSLDKKFSTKITGILVVQEISSVIRSKDWTMYLTSLGKEISSPIGNGEIFNRNGQSPSSHSM